MQKHALALMMVLCVALVVASARPASAYGAYTGLFYDVERDELWGYSTTWTDPWDPWFGEYQLYDPWCECWVYYFWWTWVFVEGWIFAPDGSLYAYGRDPAGWQAELILPTHIPARAGVFRAATYHAVWLDVFDQWGYHHYRLLYADAARDVELEAGCGSGEVNGMMNEYKARGINARPDRPRVSCPRFRGEVNST
jgi:hypothetical protein